MREEAGGRDEGTSLQMSDHHYRVINSCTDYKTLVEWPSEFVEVR